MRISLDLRLNDIGLENYICDVESSRMSTYECIKYYFRFPNSYGAVVLKDFNSLGFFDNLWELQTVDYNSKNQMSYAKLKDIYKNNTFLGNLTDEQVEKYLHDILKLVRKEK